jgi:hypothetical protein
LIEARASVSEGWIDLMMLSTRRVVTALSAVRWWALSALLLGCSAVSNVSRTPETSVEATTTALNVPVGSSAAQDGSVLTAPVWLLAGWGEGPLVQIDPATNRVIRSVDVPDFPQASLMVNDQVWVANMSGVSRFAAADGALLGSMPSFGQPSGLLRAGESVVASTDTSLTVFDTSSRLLHHIELAELTGGQAFDGQFVWVSFREKDQIAKIDLSSGRELLRLAVGGHPTSIVFDQRFLWVSDNLENGLTKIDPTIDKVVDQIDFGPRWVPQTDWVGTMRWSAMVADQLWLVSMDAPSTWSVKHIGPTGQIVERFATPCCSANFVTTGKWLWIEHNGGITRLDTVAGTMDSVLAIEPGHTTAPCGTELPVKVAVPDATSGPTDGPAVGMPEAASGQIVKHWTRSVGVIEVRWPPDPRPLSGPLEPESSSLPWAFDSTSLLPDGPTLRLHSGSQSGTAAEASRDVVELRVVPDSVRAGGAECTKIQVRFVAPDGATQTVGFAVPDLTGPYDLGPLIGSESDFAGDPGQLNVDCRGSEGRVIQALDDRWTTPAQALRAFLSSPAGAPVDVPTPPRPFHQKHLLENDSYQFEHFTNFNEQVSITVSRNEYGWHATSWRRAQC